MMQTNKLKVNLGCGESLKRDYINVDCLNYGQKFVCDLNKKWIFEDNSVSHIYMHHVLEHLDINNFFVECSRVLTDNNQIEIIVPHCSHHSAVCHLQHKNYFALCSFDEGFTKEFGVKFNVNDRKLIWRKNFKIKWFQNFINNIINKKPHFVEAYISSYIGNIEEIRFNLTMLKGVN